MGTSADEGRDPVVLGRQSIGPVSDPLSGRSGHNITGSSEYWRLTMLADSQAD
jgi:hypothetical protein